MFSKHIDNFIKDIKLNLISEININFDFTKIKEAELNNLEKSKYKTNTKKGNGILN